MEILIIPCSIRPGALSPRVAPVLANALEATDAKGHIFETRRLPMYGTFPPMEFPPEVQDLRDRVAAADGIVWVTPTYHMALPGVAKNTLDLLDIRVMNGKINGIIGASNLDGIPAAVQIANILRFIGGRIPVGDLYIGDLRNAWPKDEEVPPPAIVDKVNAWAGRFTEAVRKLS